MFWEYLIFFIWILSSGLGLHTYCVLRILDIFHLNTFLRPGPSHKLCFEMLKEKFPKYHLKWQVRLIPGKKPSQTFKALILLVIIVQTHELIDGPNILCYRTANCPLLPTFLHMCIPIFKLFSLWCSLKISCPPHLSFYFPSIPIISPCLNMQWVHFCIRQNQDDLLGPWENMWSWAINYFFPHVYFFPWCINSLMKRENKDKPECYDIVIFRPLTKWLSKACLEARGMWGGGQL